MHLVLLNQGATAQLVADPSGSLVEGVEPGMTLVVDDAAHSVLIVGDKPTVREQLSTAAGILTELATKLRDLIAGRAAGTHTDAVEEVAFNIRNHGTNAVRVILGDGVTDETLAPGATADFKARGY